MSWELVVKQPLKLEDLAISTIIKWFASPARKCMFPMEQESRIEATVETILSTQTEIGRNYFSAIPRKFHDKLMAESIRELSAIAKLIPNKIFASQRPHCEYYLVKFKYCTLGRRILNKQSNEENSLGNFEIKFVGQMIEALFTEKVTCLGLYHQDMITFELTFAKFNLLPNLTSLTVYCHCSIKDMETISLKSNILQMLKESHNLKHLKLGIFLKIDDEILMCLVDNCALIEELDFRSSNVDDNSVHLFTQMPNLKTFHIDSRLNNCFKTVILSCERIEIIRVATSDNYDLIQIIQEIASHNDNSEKLIRLKSYSGINNTTDQILLLAKMCPLIERIALTAKFRGIVNNDCRALAGLKHLTQLHLEQYSFYRNHLKDVLDEIGHNLRSLSIVHDEQIDLNALIHINQKCPNLESLIINGCTFINYAPEHDVNKLVVRPFENLKTLYLLKGSFVKQDDNLIDEVVAFLLSNCVNVEYVKIVYPNMISAFNDVDVRRLKCLKELGIKVFGRYPHSIRWNNSCIE